jgi:hypothetical protein
MSLDAPEDVVRTVTDFVAARDSRPAAKRQITGAVAPLNEKETKRTEGVLP